MQAFIAGHGAFFILVGVLLGQLLLLSFQITRNHNVRLIRVWAVAVFDPLERSLGGALDATARAWKTYRELWRAQQENQELRLQLVSAQTEVQRLSEEAAESPRLRALLDFKEHFPYPTVAAEVIASSPGDNSNALYIDKGSDWGLTEDLAVTTAAGVVGKIIAVFPHTAHVLLIVDPSSGVGVALARSRVQGVLKGTEQQNLCQVLYIMDEEPLSVGEAVETSGLDQIYPKGLPVGTVVETSDGNIYKHVIVKPVVDLSRLETVLVILKPNSGQQQAMNRPNQP